MHSAYNLTGDKMDFQKSEILEVAIMIKKHTNGVLRARIKYNMLYTHTAEHNIKVGKQNGTAFFRGLISWEKSVSNNTFNLAF